MMPDLLSDRRKKAEKGREELEAELFQQIGQLKVELDWLKKNLSCSGREEEGNGRSGLSNDPDLKTV
jgi:hypothetical protein